MRLLQKIGAAGAIAAIGFTFAGAATPTALKAAPTVEIKTTQTGSGPQFLSHILAITDVLHNCGGGQLCPLFAPRQSDTQAVSLW